MSVHNYQARCIDREFFAANPSRLYRARRYVMDDVLLPPGIALFGDDGIGAIGELNLVIVKRIRGGRIRLLFAVRSVPTLNTDWSIINFLRSRGVDPITMRRTERN